jgi:hypothetical protein
LAHVLVGEPDPTSPGHARAVCFFTQRASDDDMMLHHLELIFVHIARTGGTSIETALTGHDWWLISPETKHLSARQIRLRAGEERWNKYFKFSVVRNPWDRVVSMFATGWWMGDHRQCGAQAEFEHFIANLAPHPNESYASLKYSEIINEKLDMIVRHEALQDGFDRVCEVIGKPAMTLGRQEARPRLHYSVYYNDVTRRKVADLFKTDIEQYGYAFDDACRYDPVELSALCLAALRRRSPPIAQAAQPVDEASSRLSWLGPRLAVGATRLLRLARDRMSPN